MVSKKSSKLIKLLIFLVLVAGLTLFTVILVSKFKENDTLMSYHANIVTEAQINENFRKVQFTGLKSQLVVMNIPPGTEVGEETHKYTEQTLFFLSGKGEAILDGKKFPIESGDVVVVTPGTKHNFINTGTMPLKIYTIYTPPNHIDGRVHRSKADSDADTADSIGESEPAK